MANVVLSNVQKRFADGTIAVHDFSLEVEDGEFLTFLGPSGCGKTTTLRMVAGLETPSAGTIHFGNRRIDDLEPGERNVAMVFQSYALYPHMTVGENLAYPLRKRGVPKPERDTRVAATAKLLQIEPLLARRPKQLSGGQQQRVALGRAIIRDPDVFLLDEPLSNLDATLRAYMRAELVQLHRRIGKTMIYVTHDQVEAMTMSTRIAVMHQGRLQQVGPPSEVYERPLNRFVASFVGTPAINFIDGRISATGDGLAFVGDGLVFPIADQVGGAESGGGRPVVAGIRPEDVTIGGGQPGQGDAEVLVVEPLGHETLVVLRVGTSQVVARAPARSDVTPGQRLPFSINRQRVHLFDAATGDRLG
ncbi:ABC transporter ATP-binding protein [Elioraea sp.]|uniref:ABC transporter ATP-binding protein n=1 Tax=Elioraea sp. TaxID=2185103 RepID=UPI0025BB494E|nr:sn-glycerol-3-phosphate ABC transporter ATP-binding protein UgpC [Elioraea sp.]